MVTQSTLLIIVLICLTSLVTSVIGLEDACSSGLCNCSKRIAHCDHLNISYIPVLPTRIQQLKFQYNYLPFVNASTFSNVSGLTSLHLTYNKISTIENDALQSLTDIVKLNLRGNLLTVRSLYNVIHIANTSRIKSLSLSDNGFRAIPSDIFENFKSYRLRYLDLSSNNIEVLNYSVFKPIKHLRTLVLTKNKILTFILDYNWNLQQLFLNDNVMRQLPQFCDTSDNSYFPNLRFLTMMNNSIDNIDENHIKCLKKLNKLSLDFNSLNVLQRGTFHSLQSLNWLSIASQRSSKSAFKIQGGAFNNSNIFTLYLHQNLLQAKHLDPDAFTGCDRLQILQISENFFETDIDILNRALSPLTSLTHLIVFKCRLQEVPGIISEKLHHLKHLDIRWNNIKQWPESLKNTNLTAIYAYHNWLQSFNTHMFPGYFRRQLETLALAENPFLCDCDFVWFVQWMRSDKHKFLNYPNGYRCLNITNRICLKNTELYISTVSVGCLIVSMVILVSLIYKYRWFIKYHIYMWRYRPRLLLNLAERRFDYDAFVSYCVEDSDWVLDRLRPVLEDGEDLKLCIHERDFCAGKMIIDNIVQHMENSRKVIIILSNAYAGSEWCQFELSLAQKLVLDMTIESVVVILLEEIEALNMSKALHALLKTTTYITWCEEDENEPMFWERLKGSMVTAVE
ncbi:toll-like receptor 13 [Patella vulgata]|uniref:toll-like receptor 13 n=1 Tax=Patella vulgata TaxID=6465 RepID=UPI00218037CF|nr:toll-like receptor 13 [Patella vulgata]